MTKYIYRMIGIMLFATTTANCSDFPDDLFFKEIMQRKGTGIINNYKTSLPLPEDVCETENLADQILQYVQLLSNGAKHQLNLAAREGILSMFSACIESQMPINLCLLGLSFKSGNDEHKVLSSEFDLGDYLSLVTLQHLAEGISHIYKPGALITIINSEPFVDEMDAKVVEKLEVHMISPDAKQQYGKTLEKLVSNFNYLRIGRDLNEAYKNMGKQAGGHKVTDDLVRFYKKELTTSRIIRAITKGVPNAPYKSEITAIAKELTQIYSDGSARIRAVLNEEYKNMVRISVRENPDRILFNLIFGQKHNPLHMVPLINTNGSCKLINKPKRTEIYETKSTFVQDVHLRYLVEKGVDVEQFH